MKESNFLFIRLFILALLGCFSAHAQGDYRFHNYTISNGLSQSYVTTIVQDNTNTLWIGTQDGLNRFDGKSFEIFTPDKSLGIGSTNFKCSIKTKDGRLWFGTASGLLLFDPNSENFETFNISSQRLLQVENISEDIYGDLWLCQGEYPSAGE